VALQTDPVTRLLEVELTFPPAAAAHVVPGALVPVDVVVGRRDAVVLVPQAAVSDQAVWVVDSAGLARRRVVEIGLVGGGMVEVTAGLAARERVVTAGASLLSEGARVRVVGGPAW
jgi:hypothetical protein